MVMGVTEIESQNIYLNDHIKQYAVIRNVVDGVVYDELCNDCTCTLTVRNAQRQVILTDASTTEESQGLFVYRTFNPLFQTEASYYAYYNCTSVSYGSGIVYSQINIHQDNRESSQILPNDGAPSPIAPTGIIGDTITEIIDRIGFGKVIEGIIETPKFLTDLYDGLINILASLILFFGKFIGILIEMLTTPSTGFKSLIEFIWTYFEPLIVAFGAPIVLYEFYVITFKVIQKDFIKGLDELLKAQLNIINAFRGVIDVSLRYIMMVVNVTIDMLKVIASAIPL